MPRVTTAMSDILQQLTNILEQRKGAAPDSSYVAQLHSNGINKILEKVGEEATETIIAAKDYHQAVKNGVNVIEGTEITEKSALISETADLWFHCMVMLSHCDCDASDVLDELARRLGVSGIEEKASRKQ